MVKPDPITITCITIKRSIQNGTRIMGNFFMNQIQSIFGSRLRHFQQVDQGFSHPNLLCHFFCLRVIIHLQYVIAVLQVFNFSFESIHPHLRRSPLTLFHVLPATLRLDNFHAIAGRIVHRGPRGIHVGR